MNDPLSELDRRLEALERQNRALKRWGGAALACAVALGLTSMASTVCKTVWAERFVLQDASGRDRARLTAYETGGVPKLALLDEQGENVVTLGVSDDGAAYLELRGKDGPVRSHLVVSAEGRTTLAPAAGDTLVRATR